MLTGLVNRVINEEKAMSKAKTQEGSAATGGSSGSRQPA